MWVLGIMAARNEETTLIGLCDGLVDPKKYPTSYLTSKIGGIPDIPPATTWQNPYCSLCSAALKHVAQIYCPLEGSPYHRNLYLFACTSDICSGKSESWKVMRSQCLESEAKAISVQQTPNITANDAPMVATDWCDNADDWGMDDEEGSTWSGKVQARPPEPSAEPESTGSTSLEVDVSSKLQDLTLSGTGKGNPQAVHTFRPFYISVVDESDLCGDTDLRHAEELLREYEKREGVAVGDMDSRCEDGGEERYEKTNARHGDKVFSRFMKRISLCPEQLLRYCWNGTPLFISEPPSNMAQMVPVCSHCGSPRTFELQLMPALVSLLQSTDSEMVLEFGTVLVYTCKRSCWTSGSSSPVEEFVFILQDPDQKLFK